MYKDLSPELKKQVDAFVSLHMKHLLIRNDTASLEETKELASNLIITALSIFKHGDSETLKLYRTIL